MNFNQELVAIICSHYVWDKKRWQLHYLLINNSWPVLPLVSRNYWTLLLLLQFTTKTKCKFLRQNSVTSHVKARMDAELSWVTTATSSRWLFPLECEETLVFIYTGVIIQVDVYQICNIIFITELFTDLKSIIRLLHPPLAL